jgi:hypothetical protein
MRTFPAVLEVAGAALVVAGIWLWSIPGALIVAGLFLVVAASSLPAPGEASRVVAARTGRRPHKAA